MKKYCNYEKVRKLTAKIKKMILKTRKKMKIIDYCNYEYDSEYIPEGVEVWCAVIRKRK